MAKAKPKAAKPAAVPTNPKAPTSDHVKIVCACDNVHLGNGVVLKKGEKALVTKDLADALAKNGQAETVS